MPFGRLGLGLRLGSSVGGFPAPFVVADTPRFTTRLDSLGDFFKTDAASFNTAIELYFTGSGGVQDMSLSGEYRLRSSAIAVNPTNTNFQWNDSTNAHSASYDALLAAITSPAISADFAIDWGNTNDCNSAVTIDKAAYKAAKLDLINADKTDFTKWQRYILVPQNRSLDSGASDANYQKTAEADMELAAENAFILMAPPIWDQDLRASPDNVHPAATAYQGDIADRMALFTARICGKVSQGGIAPKVTAVEWRTDHALATIQLDAGATTAVVDSGCANIMGYDINGTVYKDTGISLVDATTIKIDFDNQGFFTPDSDDEFKIVYGALKALPRTGVLAVKDNATIPLPLARSVIIPTISDPLLGMDFTYDVSAKAGVRTLSGSDVTAITERGGSSFVGAASYYPTYEAANNGALINGAMRVNTAFTGNAAHVFALVFTVGVGASSGVVCGFGNATSVQTTLRTALYYDASSKTIRWGQNQGSGWETLGGIVEGAQNVIIMDFQSTSVCDYYLNSTTKTGTFDPRDNMPTQTHSWMLGGAFTASTLNGTGATKVSRFWGRAGVPYGAGGDASISSIVTYLASNYGVTLT